MPGSTYLRMWLGLQRAGYGRAFVPDPRHERERRALTRQGRRALHFLGDQTLGLAPVALAEAHELRLVVPGTPGFPPSSVSSYGSACYDLASFTLRRCRRRRTALEAAGPPRSGANSSIATTLGCAAREEGLASCTTPRCGIR